MRKQKTVNNQIDIPGIRMLAERYFNSQNLVSRAWLFGSYVRGEETPSSDIDILIDVPFEQKFTLFDIAEVQEQLQKLLNKKVDVVMINGLESGIRERIKNEMLLIYEA
jgi:hypothetical protein